MIDLEMTKLCAEAMDEFGKDGNLRADYDPLHDNAQAMALVKKFELFIESPEYETPHWTVVGKTGVGGQSKDLNRAIVECVAKMQAAKKMAAV